MEYIGKLYGKIGNKYFDTGKTSEDWDDLTEDVLINGKDAAETPSLIDVKKSVEILLKHKKDLFEIWEKVDDFARNHSEIKLGKKVSDHALKLMKDRDSFKVQNERLILALKNFIKPDANLLANIKIAETLINHYEVKK